MGDFAGCAHTDGDVCVWKGGDVGEECEAEFAGAKEKDGCWGFGGE